MKAGKHFVVKDSTEMRFEVIFYFMPTHVFMPRNPRTDPEEVSSRKKVAIGTSQQCPGSQQKE